MITYDYEIVPFVDLEGADLREASLEGASPKGTIYENDIPLIINTKYYGIVKRSLKWTQKP